MSYIRVGTRRGKVHGIGEYFPRRVYIVERLLGANAHVNAPAAGDGGRTALQAAADGGHLPIVDRLLAANADVNVAPAAGWSGRTALQEAVANGHLEIIQKLLAARRTLMQLQLKMVTVPHFKQLQKIAIFRLLRC